MKILVLDTETTSLSKPFCYNVGYVIADTDTRKILVEKDFVVEQVWHNMELFSTAYYADKRKIYVSAMKGRKSVMDKWGYIMRELKHDMKVFNVEYGYAYNSPFDEKTFDYNCDWFKTYNPLDVIPIYDVRAYAIKAFVDADYKAFCDTNNYHTDAGNYSTTAETMYRYLFDGDFEEEHTALSDSKIELEILFAALDKGVDITKDEKPPRSIEKSGKTFTVKKNGVTILSEKCKKIVISKNKQTISIS